MKIAFLGIAVLYLFVLATVVAGQDVPDADRAWRHIEEGDTEGAFWLLADMYRAGGAEIADDGVWQLKLKTQDYKEIINQYHNGFVQISVSRMMKPEETADYWENWSRVLAAGNFDHKNFFTAIPQPGRD